MVVELGQLHWLFLLCLVFLLAVSAHGAFKLVLNVYKGRLGEQLLRQLRRELCGRVLRFPPREFERVSSQELGAMITAEADMLGSFIGDAFALPLLQGGLLLTAVAYIFAQNMLMGVAALALFSVQGYVIPRLQREVNTLNRQRVLAVRSLSGRLGEAVNFMPEIRASATGRQELERLDGILGPVFELRYGIFKRKSFIKFFNNFLFQLTPFLFLLVGGYLVIRGELTIGALVAVLAAYKDLPPLLATSSITTRASRTLASGTSRSSLNSCRPGWRPRSRFSSRPERRTACRRRPSR